VTSEAAKILIVDDDEPTSLVIRLSLEMEGYRTAVAPSREDALSQISEGVPDLVIMDFVMGGLDAGLFIGKAREYGFGGPIILCTGMDHQLTLPVSELLMKPFDPDFLVERVKALLGSAAEPAD
jgi:two-component system phosphate regulon response regulator PhoB